MDMDITLEKKGKIAYVELNRPEKRNAITLSMWKDLSTFWKQIKTDEDIWAVILTGKGDNFSVGTDLKEMASLIKPDGEEEYRRDFWNETSQTPLPYGLWKPIIAAIKGHCIGMGFSLAVASDFIIASEDATFSTPEVKVGFASTSINWFLLRKVPLNIASEILLNGKTITAAEAHRWGLVNYITPADQVLARAEELANQICKNAPLAVRITKEILHRSFEMGHDETSRLAESLRALLYHSEDVKEGPLSFVEKRAPRYKAR